MEKQLEQRSEQEELKDIIASREDGFGHRLKTARKEKNLSTLDVARELRLDEKTILALESEDHNRLPASAFVCGYIRNYAKFMHLQPEPLVDYYKKEISDDGLDPELKITKGKDIRKNINASNVFAPIGVVLLLIVVAVGGWMLWDKFSTDLVEGNTDPVAEVLPIHNAIEPLEENESDPDSLSLPIPEESIYTPPKEVTEEKIPANSESEILSEPLVQQETADIELPSAQNETDSIEITDDDPAGVAAEVVEGLEQSQALPEPVNEAESSSSNGQLTLEFSGNSWIVIKDADNNKLSQGLKKSGEIIKLEGKKPYRIFLGDARVVTVSIHGKIFDHAHFINDKNIARFNVE